jgi:hypothetical protein
VADEVEFDELREERQALADITLLHRPSVRKFKHPSRPWFFLELDETPTDDALRHISSTATCLESLADVPTYLADDEAEALEGRAEDRDLTSEFARTALEADDDRWQSDRAARVYARVRSLTPILRLTPPDVLDPFGDRIHKHVTFVWDRLEPREPRFQGISEAPEVQEEQELERVTYPPNAFHTYWAVRLLDEYVRQNEFPELGEELLTKRAVAELWTKQALASQTGLIQGDAEHVDAQQLAWALSLEFTHAHVSPITASSPRLELYRNALDAFFEEQMPSGTWPLYEPLFHYPAAGNAYCYTYETLTELLRPALSEKNGNVLRQLLRPHLRDLLDAWHFARRTAIDTGGGTLGWCSGHHPHRTAPEAWATAEVFSFLQALRRLVAFWAQEEAARALGVRRPRATNPEEGRRTLRERGDTWTQQSEWTVGRRLAALFLHPLDALYQSVDSIDPDRPLIASDKEREQARAAILFGPPGASKTTLVEGLAAAIDWQFVEIHAADFLREGMDQVPARADEIFAQLMELDRCVVLFDEIDELIRQRHGEESDPFGRFLTTSMLPKLAKLWEQRRILYFVATNDIDAADPAIRRSQRFDAAIFAAPPSFAVKANFLEKELGVLPGALTYEAVSDALTREWNEDCALGVFALLRFDQIAELAERLRPHLEGNDVEAVLLKKELWRMGHSLERLEWRHEPHNAEDALNPYQLYKHLRDSERRDSRMLQLLTMEPDPPTVAKGVIPFANDSSRYFEVRDPLERVATTGPEGRWEIADEGWSAQDNGLLEFSVTKSE